MYSNTNYRRLLSSCIVSGTLAMLSLTIGLAAPVRNTFAATSAASPAADAFQRFKKLEGKWKGRSTKGWQETVEYKTIAAGTVVVESSFDAHPNEQMMTMVYLDGNRLMLTHYCVAKNQPRLVATSFSDEGRVIAFTFLDATNLASRDKGHMDKAIFRFIDDNHLTTQWTWYQNGKEDWMEQIDLERQ
jgi:hypothetical protein